jgi:hypothetical protein
LLRGQTYGDYNAFQILHHIVIGEPKHAVSARCKPVISSAVVAKTGFEVVALTVDFDNELAGMRDEVRDVAAHWGLSAKSESSKSVRFQMTPQKRFGTRHRAS